MSRRRLTLRWAFIGAAAAAFLAGMTSAASRPPRDGPTPAMVWYAQIGGVLAGVALIAVLPLVEGIAFRLNGLRWRVALAAIVCAAVALEAVGLPQWAHRPRDLTICVRDGLTHRRVAPTTSPTQQSRWIWPRSSPGEGSRWLLIGGVLALRLEAREV